MRGGISRVGGKKCEEKIGQMDSDQEEAAGEERFPQGYCSCFLAPEVGDGADEDGGPEQEGGEIQGAPNEAWGLDGLANLFWIVNLQRDLAASTRGRKGRKRSLKIQELVKKDGLWYILRHEGVGALLPAYGGCGAMAGVDHRLLGEGEEFSFYALYKGLEIASGEVGAADAHVEEGISGEDDPLAQEGDAT